MIGAYPIASMPIAGNIAQAANLTIAPGAAALTITGFAPSVVRTAGASVLPGSGALAFTGYPPTVTRGASLNIPVGAAVPATVVLTGYAPSISQANNLMPHYADATIMRLSVVRGTASIGPDRIQQTTGFP